MLADPWFARIEPSVDHDFGSNGPRRDEPATTAAKTLDVTLPAGMWAGKWIDPVSGAVVETLIRKHGGGAAQLTVPSWTDDLALDLRRFVSP